jgi:hypothetical protein
LQKKTAAGKREKSVRKMRKSCPERSMILRARILRWKKEKLQAPVHALQGGAVDHVSLPFPLFVNCFLY